MICTPGKIRLQLPADSYQRMRAGRTSVAKWDACTITCRDVGKIWEWALLAATLQISMRSTRDRWCPKSYSINMRVWHTRWRRGIVSSNACSPSARGFWQPGGLCNNIFVTWTLWTTLQYQGRGDTHGAHAARCWMQVDPRYPAHINAKECWVGTERHHQQDGSAISACFAWAIKGAQECAGEGWDLKIPWPLALAGLRWCLSHAKPTPQGARDLGKGQTGVV